MLVSFYCFSNTHTFFMNEYFQPISNYVSFYKTHPVFRYSYILLHIYIISYCEPSKLLYFSFSFAHASSIFPHYICRTFRVRVVLIKLWRVSCITPTPNDLSINYCKRAHSTVRKGFHGYETNNILK